MPRYDVFLEGRAESSTCYFGVAVMADDQKEAEYLGHEAGRKKHRECDEIEVVGVMPVISARNAGGHGVHLHQPRQRHQPRAVHEVCQERV